MKVNVTVLTSGLINLRAGCLGSVIVLAPLSFYCQKLYKKKEEAPPNNEENSFKSVCLLEFQSYSSLLYTVEHGKAELVFVNFLTSLYIYSKFSCFH